MASISSEGNFSLALVATVLLFVLLLVLMFFFMFHRLLLQMTNLKTSSPDLEQSKLHRVQAISN